MWHSIFFHLPSSLILRDPKLFFKFLSPHFGRCRMTSTQQFFCSYKFLNYIHGPDCERSNRNSNTVHTKNFKMEAGFTLSHTWQPVISLMKCSQ
jgi:hypothetical protein